MYKIIILENKKKFNIILVITQVVQSTQKQLYNLSIKVFEIYHNIMIIITNNTKAL